ncbi:hypothetical protein CC86DRAFT_408718 [Ophiobolus disseminans]|uniref:Uncharacterized protein n=1 Tax=Ophiobolus disseminans TaxID=1469910 RepID=A0A6A6ZRJ9_9PLEO|nr:hypothetical protein CC86DRAFT_408718 [Ophiobolus disseminans]
MEQLRLRELAPRLPPTTFEHHDFDRHERNFDIPSYHHANFVEDEHSDLVALTGKHGAASQYTSSYAGAKSMESLRRPGVDPALHVFWRGLPHYLLTWELLGIALSVCFLTLGGCVVALRGKEESLWSIRVIRATQIAPSIWPIIFSGVLGNAVRSFADWRIERGVTIMDLEQLLGSLTMAGSIITIFRWSLLRTASVVFIFLWAFNPLGSQASFRLAYLHSAAGFRQGVITFVNPDVTKAPRQIMFDTTLGTNRAQPTVQALYATAIYDIMSRTQNVDNTTTEYASLISALGGQEAAGAQAAMDIWGNLRIPNLEYLGNYDSKHAHEWHVVPWKESIQTYTSLIGDMFSGVERGSNGITTFNLSSSYQSFNCSPWNFVHGNASQWFIDNVNITSSVAYNPRNRSISNIYIFLATPPINSTCKTPEYRPPLFFGTTVNRYAANGSATTSMLATTQCSLSTSYVDSQAECITKAFGKANCGVRKIRKQRDPPTPPGSSLLDGCLYFSNGTRKEMWGAWQVGLNDAFMHLLNLAQTGSGAPGIVEKYLHDPLTAFGQVTKGFNEIDKTDVKVIERRLSLLYNTLWKASWMHPAAISGNLSLIRGMNLYDRDLFLNSTSRTAFPLPSVYAINAPWMVLYFASVGVMFSAAVFSLIMHAQCRAPTILGFASSLIRDSSYFCDPAYHMNSTEDGAQKSKRLGATMVRVADVRADDDIGKVAFAPAGLGRRVGVKRWYE